MAQTNLAILLHKLRGGISQQLAVKQYGKQTVVTAYLDMSRVQPGNLQKEWHLQKLCKRAIGCTPPPSETTRRIFEEGLCGFISRQVAPC